MLQPKKPLRIPTTLPQRGFTFIEALIGVTILLLISAIGVAALVGFRNTASMNAGQDRVLAVLRLARSHTIASQGLSVYGVHFAAESATLFTGATYVSGSSGNTEYPMPAGIEIANVDLSTWPDVVFTRLTGEAQGTGRILVRAGATGSSREITIRDHTELVGATGLTQLGTRLTDTRHVHFDLGWSMQDATTLRLTFTTNTGGTQVTDIAAASYFSGGPPPTAFDWSGSISVDGMNQTLRVHTHLLNVGNTVLSVHRNRLENTKALRITVVSPSLGTRDIASYTSTGTLTVEAFGGTATVQ